MKITCISKIKYYGIQILIQLSIHVTSWQLLQKVLWRPQLWPVIARVDDPQRSNDALNVQLLVANLSLNKLNLRNTIVHVLSPSRANGSEELAGPGHDDQTSNPSVRQSVSRRTVCLWPLSTFDQSDLGHGLRQPLRRASVTATRVYRVTHATKPQQLQQQQWCWRENPSVCRTDETAASSKRPTRTIQYTASCARTPSPFHHFPLLNFQMNDDKCENTATQRLCGAIWLTVMTVVYSRRLTLIYVHRIQASVISFRYITALLQPTS